MEKNKPKNTSDKLNFYALYLYSMVSNNHVLTTDTLNDVWKGNIDLPIVLKHPLYITDEHIDCLIPTLEAIIPSLAKYENRRLSVREGIMELSQSNNLHTLPSSFVDKIRLLGYAFDWNGYSIDDMVEFGWIELKKTFPER